MSNAFDDRIPNFPESGLRSVSRAVIIVVVIVIIGGLVGVGAFVQVPAGNRGVVVSFGKVEDRILNSGLNFKIPIMQTVVFMNVQIQKAESTESTATADLQEVSTTVAVNFRLDSSKVNVIYRDLRQDYITRVIKPNIEEGLKATTAEYRAEELITKRAEVKATLDEILEKRLREFNIQVVSVSLTDFQFSRSFNDAIEAKVTAEQQALQAKNKLEQIRYEAQQKIIQAEAEKNATIRRAEGDAEAQLLEANAKAQVIQLITSQMTPEYAQYLWLQTWDGKLPAVLSGEGQGIILDITQLTQNNENN
jgi:regulator of protease activity HflC (stomatin/prohibitin superfamily)